MLLHYAEEMQNNRARRLHCQEREIVSAFDDNFSEIEDLPKWAIVYFTLEQKLSSRLMNAISHIHIRSYLWLDLS